MRRPVSMRVPRAPVLLLAYTALSVLFFHAVWGHPDHDFIGAGGDPEQTMWFLAWVPHAIVNHLNPLVTNHMNYPFGLNLMWNTSMPLAGLILWPFTALVGPMLSYNLVMTLCPPLSAWCAYLAIRRYVPGHAGPAIGGLLYGFSPYMMAQSLGHANLVMGFIPPLLLIVLGDVLVTQRWRWWVSGLALAALLTAQLLLGEELLALALLAAVVAIGVLALLHRSEVRAHLPHAGRALALAVAASLALSAWPVAVQLLGPERPTTELHGHDIFVSDLLNFVVPTSVQLFAPDRAVALSTSFTGNASEWGAYIGVPLILVLIFVLVRHRRIPIVRISGLSGVVLAVLSLGGHLHVGGHRGPVPFPWALISRMPLIGRALPNRLMLFVFLFVALLVAIFIERASAQAGRRRMIGAWAVVIASLLALMPRPPLIASTVMGPAALEVPPLFRASDAVGHSAEGAILVMPFPSGTYSAPVLWQATSGMRFRMVGGYFIGPIPEHSAVPRLRDTLVDIEDVGVAAPLSPVLRGALTDELRRADVRSVLAGPSVHHTTAVAFMTALLGRPPVHAGGVDVWDGLDGLRR